MSDQDILAAANAALFADTLGPDGLPMQTPLVSANQMAKRRSHNFPLNDAATAGTAVTESVIAQCDAPNGWKIISAKFVTPVAVVADNTDFCTVTVSKRTAAGAATIVATATTKAASMNGPAAFVPGTLVNSATAANLLLASGDVLTVLVSKGGAGKAITAATSLAVMHVVYEEK